MPHSSLRVLCFHAFIIMLFFAVSLPRKVQNAHSQINLTNKSSSYINESTSRMKSNYSVVWESKQIDLKKCIPCNFTVRNYKSDSTERDVVLGTALHKTYTIIPYVRTLRTTGSKAQVIFFMDHVAISRLTTETTNFLKDCGVSVMFVNVSDDADRKAMLMTRNLILAEFLTDHVQDFDRVLITDIYDTTFQGDPFYSEFERDAIMLSRETKKVELAQLREAKLLAGVLGYQSLKNQFQDYYCINVGTITGECHKVAKFLQLYVNLFESVNNLYGSLNSGFIDQVLANILVRAKIPEENGLKVKLYNEYDLHHCMWYVYGRKEVDYTIGNYRIGQNYPLSVHLYDREKTFCESVRNACLPTFQTKDPYIRCR